MISAVEESQSKLQNLESVTLEYQKAQEEAAEQARKAELLAMQLQETESMHVEEKNRLVGDLVQNVRFATSEDLLRTST